MKQKGITTLLALTAASTIAAAPASAQAASLSTALQGKGDCINKIVITNRGTNLDEVRQFLSDYGLNCNLSFLEKCIITKLPNCSLPSGWENCIPNLPETEAPNQPGTDSPDLPGTESPNQPGADSPDKPETEAPNQPGTDSPDKPETEAPNQPGTDSPDLPETEAPNQPGTDSPNLPETEAPNQPGADSPDKPETEAPNQPGTDSPDLPETEAPNQPGTDSPQRPENTPSEETDTNSAYVNRIVKLVNEERAKAGLSPVTLDKKVQAAAQVRAKEIVTSFSHTRPDGTSFSTALKEQNVSYRGSGENIAWGQRSPEEVMKGWMNSSGHRANILNKNFTTIGVGYYQTANGTNHWVQLFTY